MKEILFDIRREGDTSVLYRDGAPLLTPRNLPVAVPFPALADALLAECRGQGKDGRMDLRKMPAMQMTLTSLDITSAKRGEIVDGVVRYGENELLCLRADAPPELAAAQEAAWRPYLDWVRGKFGAALAVGAGIAAAAQKPEELEKLRAPVVAASDWRLTGISEAVGVTGSLVLGLALACGFADAEKAAAASEHDALWQMKKWGEDPAALARYADIVRELKDIERWFSLTA